MNLILLTDSYKLSHFNQYPKNTQKISAYLSPRGGMYENIVWFGLNYYIKKYLSQKITQKDIAEAKKFAMAHGTPFYEEGWNYILKKHNGILPVKIYALPELSIVKAGTPLMVVENTDEKCFWLVSYLETLLLKVWYPTTIATKSYAVRQVIEKYYQECGENIEMVRFAYHNFGDRGSSSVEAAAIGGVAHLTQFAGTDNFNALKLAKEFYPNIQGFSIPATEHSTITSWGRENEFEAITNYLETYKNSSLIACVCDSYDIYKTVNFLTSGAIKAKIESNEYPTFVIRPDSGEPISQMVAILEIMEKNKVKFTLNSKGYKVFDKYRIIWGDGITLETINNILYTLTSERFKYSPINFAFGSGGDLMQNITRDTCKFAFKTSAIMRDNQWHDVYKDPITDANKKSIRGRVDTTNMITVF